MTGLVKAGLPLGLSFRGSQVVLGLELSRRLPHSSHWLECLVLWPGFLIAWQLGSKNKYLKSTR